MGKAKKTGRAARGTKAAARQGAKPVARPAASKSAARRGTKSKAGSRGKARPPRLSGEMPATDIAIRSAFLSKL